MVVFGMGNRARKYLRHLVALEDAVDATGSKIGIFLSE